MNVGLLLSFVGIGCRMRVLCVGCGFCVLDAGFVCRMRMLGVTVAFCSHTTHSCLSASFSLSHSLLPLPFFLFPFSSFSTISTHTTPSLLYNKHLIHSKCKPSSFYTSLPLSYKSRASPAARSTSHTPLPHSYILLHAISHDSVNNYISIPSRSHSRPSPTPN